MATMNSLYETLHRDGGFTYHVKSYRAPQAGDKKFAVSYDKRLERTFPLAQFTPADLVNYVADNEIELSKPGVYLGAWVDGDTVYLDCSIVTEYEGYAFLIGRAHNQISYFCFETMTAKNIESLISDLAA